MWLLVKTTSPTSQPWKLWLSSFKVGPWTLHFNNPSPPQPPPPWPRVSGLGGPWFTVLETAVETLFVNVLPPWHKNSTHQNNSLFSGNGTGANARQKPQCEFSACLGTHKSQCRWKSGAISAPLLPSCWGSDRHSTGYHAELEITST